MAKGGRKKRVRAGSDNSSGENSADQPDLKEASEFAKRRSLLMERTTIPPGLENEDRRDEWELPKSTTKPGHYMVELNLLHVGGLKEADKSFQDIYRQVIVDTNKKDRGCSLISKAYYSCFISVQDWRELVREDERQAGGDRRKLAIYKIWPDFPVRPTLDRSVSTIKADAAVRSFAATGAQIVWAVIDSGIQANHPHFERYENLTHQLVVGLHRDYTRDYAENEIEESSKTACQDRFGHGTHVAGIIAGGIDKESGIELELYQKTYTLDEQGKKQEITERRGQNDVKAITGIAPSCRLVSLKVLDENGGGRTSNIIRALSYIRDDVNGDPKLLRIHGVNLSVGYEFDAQMFACGQSPLCVEVDRLVKSGVVVVTSSGNTGYGKLSSDERPTRVGMSNTINDPGNAALAITVGSTHRDSPHTFGVSYFSSKGPTGDGRLKPDLVAPGERITSCATGKFLAPILGPAAVPARAANASGATSADSDAAASNDRGAAASDGPAAVMRSAVYVDQSGTSMAAPHVSGAIAAFLSIRQEFIQRPERVKEVFLQSATCLGRERYFQGHGLVDLMRAIQSV